MRRTFVRLIVIQLLSFQFAFGQTPNRGDLIELQGAFFARSSAHFRAIDGNKITVLRKGAKGQIMEVKPISSRAYGICIKVFPRPGTSSHNIHGPNDCVWVYYKAEQNLIRITPSEIPVLPTVKVTAPVPEAMDQAEALVNVPGIADSVIKQALKETSAESETAVQASFIPALIEDAVSALQTLGQSSAAASCVDCDTKVEMNQARCDTRSSNVDRDLRNLLQSNPRISIALKRSEEVSVLKLSTTCINRIQANSSLGKSYASGCTSEQQPLSKSLLTSEKTCASQLYSEVTAQSFNLIYQCTSPHLGFGNAEQNRLIKDMAALITQESQFHHNAVNSRSLAAGLGQLFPEAITDVNTKSGGREYILNQMRQSSRSECRDLADYLSAYRFSGATGKTCQTVSLEAGNPLTNLFYSFAYMGINRSYTERLITKSLSELRAISPEVKSQLELDLSLLSHNAGIGNVRSATLRALREFMPRYRFINAKNYPRFLETISRKLGPAEQKNYLSNLQNSYRRLGGDSCFQ